MIKAITLRCAECGETYTFTVGAGAKLTNWHDVAARIADKKENDKLMEIIAKYASGKSKAALQEFTLNTADALDNICYNMCGVETKNLLMYAEGEDPDRYFCDITKEGIASSTEKWKTATQREGLLAFEAMYLCPKTQHVKQGLYVSIRWKEGAHDKLHVVPNKSDESSTPLVLLDDGNVGFMHENCPTIAHCEKCNSQLVVDKVSFKIPQPEN